MRIGVLIPTYNRKHYLSKSLGSVIGQSYQNLEIIVIDNGSTDGTAQFMTSISDLRVRYIVNDSNIGMIASINKGINLFSDEVKWCSILSDDDFLDRDFITRLLYTVTAFSAKSIVHSHRIFIDKQGKRIREAVLSPQEETALEYIKMRACFKRETYLSGVLFNRTAFVEIKGYPAFSTGLATDDAFIFALSLKDRLLFEKTALAFIRIHDEAESRVYSDGVTKLQTLRQFDEYCKKAVRESGIFNDRQSREIENALKKYLISLNSFLWIQTAHYMLDQKDKIHEQLFDLFSFAKDNSDKLSFRIKFAVACQKLIGIFPEGYTAYRAWWENIIKLSLLFKKISSITSLNKKKTYSGDSTKNIL